MVILVLNPLLIPGISETFLKWPITYKILFKVLEFNYLSLVVELLLHDKRKSHVWDILFSTIYVKLSETSCQFIYTTYRPIELERVANLILSTPYKCDLKVRLRHKLEGQK